jgi:hypothetical protein
MLEMNGKVKDEVKDEKRACEGQEKCKRDGRDWQFEMNCEVIAWAISANERGGVE